MDRDSFSRHATSTLEALEDRLGGLEHDQMDVELAGDVLTLHFEDGSRFILNSHGAALQIWMAAEKRAWHFDPVEDRDERGTNGSVRWVAARTNEELLETVAQVVGTKLGATLDLKSVAGAQR